MGYLRSCPQASLAASPASPSPARTAAAWEFAARHAAPTDIRFKVNHFSWLCWWNLCKMRRAVASSIAVLLAAVLSIAVIASSRQADETTELLKLLPNGLPDISGIQTGPPTKAQIMAQMKKDGLSLNLFNQVPCTFAASTRMIASAVQQRVFPIVFIRICLRY
jgi:hypothetical protein